ncbi:DUF7694 domain-containing protein [Dyadobacter helix]|nr:hypothetical protein [Dyadobacter sp. CECT 9275]
MNKDKQRRIEARKLLLRKEDPFVEIDLSKIDHPAWMTRCFRNNRYTVMIDDQCKVSTGTAIRAMVQSHLNLPIQNHWSEMQRIKNVIFGPETTAIEYYPAESRLENRENIYWMWVFNDGLLPIPV